MMPIIFGRQVDMPPEVSGIRASGAEKT